MNAKSRWGRSWLALAATVMMGAAACGQANLDKAGGPIAKPVVLTLADDSGDLSGAQPFATAVKELSNGTLQIKIEGPSARLGDENNETEVIRAVQAGKAQLGITGTQAFDTIAFGSLQALQAPFLINSYRLQRKVLDSGIPQKMLAALQPTGLVGVGLLPGVLARPFGFSRPLVAASDYKGARIGVLPSLVEGEAFRALGARPDSSGRLAGLAGVETDVFTADEVYQRPGATLTGNVVFWPWNGVIFMNRRASESLTAAQRGDLVRAAVKAQGGNIYLGNDAGYLRDLCRRGTKVLTASAADLSGMRAAVRPVYRALESNPSTRAFISQITAIREAIGGSPDSLTCPAAATPGGTAAAALQGTWQVSYTKQDLLAAGADPTRIYISEETWGHFSLRFIGGQWSLQLISGDPGVPASYRLAYGTYAVAGDKIVFHRHDHDYPGSDSEVWGPYEWSVYRGMLTFKKAGSAPMPTGPVVKLWRKTGT